MPLVRFVRAARRAAALSALAATAALACGLASAAVDAVPTETWNARFQTTYVWQAKPAYSAAYSGPNSLTAHREKSYSYTLSAAFGVRPWSGAELYFDPEAAQGVPL
ncbi:MAG TPA: carbohydrate porin, partial [Burkholderiales bacterium]|nr:carbohydrate porin [Burkholderiales bacterium]